MSFVSSPQRALAPAVLGLALEVDQLRARLLEMEAALSSDLTAVHPDNLPSARNLAHYLALRQYDVRDLQLRLARVGLSSLGRSESHVLVTLDRIIAMLALARGNSIPETEPPPVGFRHGERMLRKNARNLLGPPRQHRDVRIVVTLPPEAATDPQVVADFMAAVWATQVLDNLAKEGALSRAEVTDAAMSGRAEAVMLNKGPFITDAIRTLDDILGRMHKHQSKKRALFRALHVGSSLWSSTGIRE